VAGRSRSRARRIAWNASGRNTGFVLPALPRTMDAVVRRVGLEHAKRLWELSDAGPICPCDHCELSIRRPHGRERLAQGEQE